MGQQAEEVIRSYISNGIQKRTGETVVDYAYRMGAQESLRQANLFTQDEMFLFAGFMMGKKALDPFIDVALVMEEWKKDFRSEQLDIIKSLDNE